LNIKHGALETRSCIGGGGVQLSSTGTEHMIHAHSSHTHRE